jgi:hypothetical protein
MSDKPSLAERLLAKKRAEAQPAAAPTLTKLAPANPQPEAKPPKEKKPTTLFSCGHSGNLPPNCPACREKIAVARRERRHARKAAKKAQEPAPQNLEQRLPDGSRFNVVWDFAAVLWRGTLTLTDGTVFEGEASGVFRLLKNLDAMYRAR